MVIPSPCYSQIESDFSKMNFARSWNRKIRQKHSSQVLIQTQDCHLDRVSRDTQ